jgi:hypothetical protein
MLCQHHEISQALAQIEHIYWMPIKITIGDSAEIILVIIPNRLNLSKRYMINPYTIATNIE